MNTLIQNWIKMSTCKPASEIFAAIINRIETHFSSSTSTPNIHELKGKKTTKEKGNLWETFCQMYLEANDYTVYTLNNIPEEVSSRLKLPKNDIGIDLIAIKNGKHIAVQCKYRYPNSKSRGRFPKTLVKYFDLSTFITLCSRTGPWHKHFVMTNCHGASWKGLKTSQDFTFAKKKFENTPLSIWMKMAGSTGHSLIDTHDVSSTSSTQTERKSEIKIDDRKVREARLAFYSKLSNKSL